MINYDQLARQIRACQCVVEGLATQLDVLAEAVSLGRAQQAQLAECLHTEKQNIATMSHPTAWRCKDCGMQGGSHLTNEEGGHHG